MVELQRAEAPIRLFLSAGPYHRDGFISTQQAELDLLKRTEWEESFGTRRAHTLLAEHVWEHLTIEDGIEAARICYDYLEPGGLLRIGVPDGLHPDENYQKQVAVNGPGPASDHRALYTYKSLPPVLEAAGFITTLLEFWDEEGKFQATDWNPEEGLIFRSLRFDPRNQNGNLGFTSLIVDARKPG